MASSSSTKETETPPPSPVASLPEVKQIHQEISLKLSSANFLLWKTQIFPVLCCHGLLGFIDGTMKKPTTSADDISQWNRLDQMVLGWLLVSLSDSVLSQVVDKCTARDVWLTLELLNGSRSRARIQQIKSGSKPLLGDILVIRGTIFFSVSNVGEEFCVKQRNLVEVVSMIGLFGMLVSACETAIFERKSLESVVWSAELILAFAGFAVLNFMFYTFCPFVLKMSGSTLFNLSLLTSDMWAVVICIFFYKQQVNWMYYLASALVLIGLLVYSKAGEKDPVSSPASEDESLNTSYQRLDEEIADTGPHKDNATL